MPDKSDTITVLKQIDVLERELIRLKKEVLQTTLVKGKPKKTQHSLFGSVKGGDITDEIIEDSKKRLFRALGEI